MAFEFAEECMKEMNTTEDYVPKIFYNVFRKCQPEWWLRPHFVEHNEITYIINGKARYTLDGIDYELSQGDLLCLTEGVKRTAITYPNSLMQCFSVNFYSLYPESVCPPPVFPLVNHIGIRRDLIDMFKELTVCWSNQRQGYIMRTRALLMLILNHLSEILIYKIDKMTGDYRINKTIRTMAMHYSDKITVKGLAEQVHLDEAYFGHLFKKETGITVHQYLRQVRVRNAESMLQSGSYKVHEVAELCGFSDVFHFYKLFKEIRGFPPSKCMSKKLQI
ncbi:MAG: AraC family transcriptional regulator [Spirochaetaceae bacterium]|jgi:AraC-like DNA-binding protein|nr:AraC family transcriptional regulator [Spirochaetaceae bacterium]